jgi:hypothetical protein
MDPDTTLAILRKGCEMVSRMEEDDVDPVLADMVEAFESLDEWLSKGGFVPRDWSAGWFG